MRAPVRICCQNTQLRLKPKTIRQSDVATLTNNLEGFRMKINFYSIMPIILEIVIDAITFSGILFRVCVGSRFSRTTSDEMKNSLLEFHRILFINFSLLFHPFVSFFFLLLSEENENGLNGKATDHPLIGTINMIHK